MLAGAWKETRAINPGLVDSSIRITLCVSRNQGKSISKTSPCVSIALFSIGYKPHTIGQSFGHILEGPSGISRAVCLHKVKNRN